MSTNTLLFGVLFVLIAVAIFFIVRIELRLKKIFQGRNVSSLEELISDIVEKVKKLEEETATQEEHLTLHDNQIQKLGRGVKLLRFNPFPDVGGNQSFAVAIINEEGDGVVFSSLYSRERMSVFAKPITHGKSDIELTPEEQSVVTDAQKDVIATK